MRDLESGLVRLELAHYRAMAAAREAGSHGAAAAEAGMSVIAGQGGMAARRGSAARTCVPG